MERLTSHSEQISLPAYLKVQRTLLAACIILAPLSITLYVLAWPENPAPVAFNATQAAPIVTSTMAGPTGNTLHFIGGIAASFFLPLGYLGMSLLGMRRSPWLATLSAALSLVGWIPWSALIGIDDLAYDIAQVGSTPQFAALWTHFNSDSIHLPADLYHRSPAQRRADRHHAWPAAPGAGLGCLGVCAHQSTHDGLFLGAHHCGPIRAQIYDLRPVDHRRYPRRPGHAQQQGPDTTSATTHVRASLLTLCECMYVRTRPVL
jgi:hypothetical protein